jgi:NADPH-dependent curcumin reductase CurA
MRNSNRQWRLKRRPVGEIKAGDLELIDAPKPVPGDGEVLVRNIYLSLDPTNRIWMSDMEQYMPPVAIGDVMRGGTLGVVEQSNAEGFAPGDIVLPGMGGWQDYTVASASGPIPARKLPQIPSVPLSSHMSALGVTGATAYFGLLDLGKPQAGETVVVSAAAGAVGQIVGQIAKIKGAASWACGMMRSAIRRKGTGSTLASTTRRVTSRRLKRECPKGIDVDFENVGGAILDAVLANINLKARIALCGLISQYNADGPVPGPYNFTNILMKRARIEGFIIIDYIPRFGEFAMQMAQWVMEGKVKDRVDINDGLEHAVTTLGKLFTGGNTGKLLVRVSPEP